VMGSVLGGIFDCARLGNIQDLPIDEVVEFETAGNFVTNRYYVLKHEIIEDLKLPEIKKDVLITAFSEKGYLLGLYFAEESRFQEIKSWKHKFHQQDGLKFGKRKDNLHILVHHEFLEGKKNFDFTISIDKRPKFKAENKQIDDSHPIPVKFLAAKVKARRPIVVEFYMVGENNKNSKAAAGGKNNNKQQQQQQQGGKKKDEKTANDNKSSDKTDETDDVDTKKDKRRTEKIFHPPDFPWEDWKIGLVFKDGTRIVEEATGQANEINPGWIVEKIQKIEVTDETFPKVWGDLQTMMEADSKCMKIEGVETKHRGDV